MRFLVIICIAFIWLKPAHIDAQQSIQWTQYVFNQYAINPAYAGLDRSLSITAGLRSQWSQFEGAPKTQLISGHLPLYFLGGAAGGMIINDELGAFKRTAATISYNYVIDSPGGLISAGFRIGGQRVTLDNNAITTPDGIYTDGSIDHQDFILANADLSGVAPIWSLGLFYVKDLLEVGLAVDNVANSSSAGSSRFSESTVFSLYGAYQLPITEVLTVEPNMLIKTDGIQTQLDIGVLGHYNQFIAGLSLRGYSENTLDAIGVTAGIRVNKNVRVSYSFDLGLSGLGQFHDGTHEFIFNYNLNKPIRTGELPRIIYNPRYN